MMGWNGVNLMHTEILITIDIDGYTLKGTLTRIENEHELIIEITKSKEYLGKIVVIGKFGEFQEMMKKTMYIFKEYME